ncbi:MAG: hypothetical protein KJI71_05760 [Patescibacteria group bacterium]|nr:hypothetical protein [Patescibacteria group bacterium]
MKLPPLEVLKSKNCEYIILWMLRLNESCRWHNFTDSPVSLSTNILSGYLRKMSNDLILKERLLITDPEGNEKYKKVYRITESGRKRLNEIQSNE